MNRLLKHHSPIKNIIKKYNKKTQLLNKPQFLQKDHNTHHFNLHPTLTNPNHHNQNPKIILTKTNHI